MRPWKRIDIIKKGLKTPGNYSEFCKLVVVLKEGSLRKFTGEGYKVSP